MKRVTQLIIVAVAILVNIPGIAQAQSLTPESPPRTPQAVPLAPSCTVSISTNPTGSIDVNQTVVIMATLSSPCTVSTGYYSFSWGTLPANCSSPAASTSPSSTTAPSQSFNCRPRYQGNFSEAQQARYYDYAYDLTVTGFACNNNQPCALDTMNMAYSASAHEPCTVFGEPRLLAGGTGSTSISAEVGVPKTLNTYFPLGAVGVNQALSKNWVLKNDTVGGNPDQIAYDSPTGQLFITNSATGYNVSAYSVDEGIVTANVMTGNSPSDAVVVGGKVYVSNSGSSNLSIINPKTDTVTGNISPVDSPTGMVYDPVNGYLYVAASTNVTVVNVTTESIAGYIPMPEPFYPQHLGYDPSTHEVYATNDYFSSGGTAAHNISAIYTAPGTIGSLVSVINVGPDPSAIGYSSVSHDIYVPSGTSNTVTIISDSTNTVVKTVGVGTYPTGITTWSGDEGHLFMSNLGSANVTVLNTTTNKVQFNFGEQGLNYAADILDYGDLVLSNVLTGNLTTVLFQNSTIPEYGSGLEAPAGSTQGQMSWTSSDSSVVSVSSCSRSFLDRSCSVDPTAPGNVTTVVEPSDTNGGDSYFGATNVTFQIHVYPRIQAGPLVSNVSTQGRLVADVGNPIALKVSVWNGTGPGTYALQWSGLPSGCGNSNAIVISCTPRTVGQYTVLVSVRDALGGTLSRTNVLTVYPAPVLSVPAASNRSAYTNTSLYVGPNVTGGAPPYRFCASSSQFSICAPCSSANSTDLSYTLVNPGSYLVRVNVTDAAGVVRTYSLTETVSLFPRLVNVLGPFHVDANQNAIFTAFLPSGYGIPPLSVSWVNASTGQLLCPVQSFASLNVTSNCAFTPSSSVNLMVTVTDSSRSSWTSYSSLTVNPDPTIRLGSLAGLPGHAIPVVVRVSGGSGPYRVCLAAPLGSCAWTTAGLAHFNVTYATAGNYSIVASVNDSTGFNRSTTAPVSVFNPMRLNPIIATLNPVDEGASDSFTAATLGGSPDFTTWWNESSSFTLCSGANLSNCTAPITGTGSATISLAIIDSIGERLSENVSITVNPRLQVQLPTETLTTGHKGWLNGSVLRGTVPYSWALSGVPGSLSQGSTGTVSIPVTFASPGNYSLYFHVNDRGGGQTSTVWGVSVLPSQTSQLTVPCAPSGPTSLHPLENGTYNLTCASGGTPPYSYAWIWADSTVTQGGSAEFHNYPAPGHYNITVMVRDASGAVAFARSLEVTVSGPSIRAPPSLPCSPTGPTNLSVGAAGDYSISCITGGVAPYSYTWEFQDGTTVASDSAITHQFSRSGTFEVTVLVTDALGRVASSSPLKVTVTATTHATSGTVWTTLTSSSLLYPLLFAVALGTAAVGYLAVRKYRRKKTKSQENDANDETKGDAHDIERARENEED